MVCRLKILLVQYSGPVPTGLNFDDVLQRQLTAAGGPRVSKLYNHHAIPVYATA